MCLLESESYESCGCRKYRNEPIYCDTYKKAHPKLPAWLPTFTSKSILKEYHFKLDTNVEYRNGLMRFFTVSHPKRDPFPPLKCRHKEIRNRPYEGKGRCEFHLIMEEDWEEAWDMEFQKSVVGRAGSAIDATLNAMKRGVWSEKGNEASQTHPPAGMKDAKI